MWNLGRKKLGGFNIQYVNIHWIPCAKYVPQFSTVSDNLPVQRSFVYPFQGINLLFSARIGEDQSTWRFFLSFLLSRHLKFIYFLDSSFFIVVSCCIAVVFLSCIGFVILAILEKKVEIKLLYI